jgi:hypothetical protein
MTAIVNPTTLTELSRHWFNSSTNNTRFRIKPTAFEEYGQSSQSAEERKALRDYNMKHNTFFETLSDIPPVELFPEEPPVEEIAIEVIEKEETSLEFLNLQQIYQYLDQCNQKNPVIAQLVNSTKIKVEELEETAQRWQTNEVFWDHFNILQRAKIDILEENPLSNQEMNSRAGVTIRCKVPRSHKDKSSNAKIVSAGGFANVWS